MDTWGVFAWFKWPWQSCKQGCLYGTVKVTWTGNTSSLNSALVAKVTDSWPIL